MGAFITYGFTCLFDYQLKWLGRFYSRFKSDTILEATMKAFAILLMITMKTVLGAPINPDGNQLSLFFNQWY